jgi:hypothetical protein
MARYRIECFHNGEQINNSQQTTLANLFHVASWLCVKTGNDEKGYTINMLESQFRKRGIKRVGYQNSFKDFSITLIRQ